MRFIALGSGKFMFISHGTKSIFIHIQKTAGDAIENAVRKDDPSLDTQCFAHRRHPFAREVKAVVSPDLWATHYRFAFVRNPWDRLVSWYSMCMQSMRPNPFAKYIQQNAPTFTDFIVRTTTGMAERTTYNQLDYLTDVDGELIVDFVGRYERLADDYTVVKARLGLTHDLSRTNASSHARLPRLLHRGDEGDRRPAVRAGHRSLRLRVLASPTTAESDESQRALRLRQRQAVQALLRSRGPADGLVHARRSARGASDRLAQAGRIPLPARARGRPGRRRRAPYAGRRGARTAAVPRSPRTHLRRGGANRLGAPADSPQSGAGARQVSGSRGERQADQPRRGVRRLGGVPQWPAHPLDASRFRRHADVQPCALRRRGDRLGRRAGLSAASNSSSSTTGRRTTPQR